MKDQSSSEPEKGDDALRENNIQLANSVKGDVIGETAYSERFVLKLLLKFANADVFKLEETESEFENDLCTLWDMSSERDVVMFLMKHDFFRLLNFIAPVLENSRIQEILFGVASNMCCISEAANVVLSDKELCVDLFKFVGTSDTSVLIQVMKLINFCVYNISNEKIIPILNCLNECDYSTSLAFIMNNSASEELLTVTLECFNCICSKCNISESEELFCNIFVNDSIVEGLFTIFEELNGFLRKSTNLVNFYNSYLEIIFNLTGFNKSKLIFTENFLNKLVSNFRLIAVFFKRRAIKTNTIDSELRSFVSYVTEITFFLNTHNCSQMNNCYEDLNSIWDFAKNKLDKEDTSNNRENYDIAVDIEKCLSGYVAKYQQNL